MPTDLTYSRRRQQLERDFLSGLRHEVTVWKDLARKAWLIRNP
jgi:hypothetical protein